MWGKVLRWKNAWRFWNCNGSLVLIIFSNTRLSSYSKLFLPFEFLPFVFRLISSSWPNVTYFIPSSLETSRKEKSVEGLGLVFCCYCCVFFCLGISLLVIGVFWVFWGVLVGWFLVFCFVWASLQHFLTILLLHTKSIAKCGVSFTTAIIKWSCMERSHFVLKERKILT